MEVLWVGGVVAVGDLDIVVVGRTMYVEYYDYRSREDVVVLAVSGIVDDVCLRNLLIPALLAKLIFVKMSVSHFSMSLTRYRFLGGRVFGLGTVPFRRSDRLRWTLREWPWLIWLCFCEGRCDGTYREKTHFEGRG